MKAIIPVAGKGTRLRPHTHAIPKPLIKVAGKEVLGHILDTLLPLGLSEVIFIVGHLHDKVEEYVRLNYPQLFTRAIKQEELKGTAHAVGLAAPYVAEEVLIIFSDTLCDADFSVIKSLPGDVDGAIWTKSADEPHKYGVVVTNPDGLMTQIVEKPSQPSSNLVNIGVQYIKDWQMLFGAIDAILAGPAKGGEYYLTDVLQYMIDRGGKIKTFEVSSWLDCGNVSDLLKTNRYLLEKGLAEHPRFNGHGVVVNEPVRVAADVRLENVEIGPNVTIESGAVIQSSKLKNSIVGRGASIFDSELSDSLVGAEAEIRSIKGSLNVADHSVVKGN